MNKKMNTATDTYTNTTHKIGKISNTIAILLILMVPAVITLVYGRSVEIQFSNTIGAIITLTAIYGVVSLVEVVSFSPFLGSAGTYLSFITGNIMNMKLPAATNALRVNNAERGSTLFLGTALCQHITATLCWDLLLSVFYAIYFYIK